MINLCVRTKTSTKNTSTMYVSNVWNTYESVMAEIKKLTLVLIDITKKKIPRMKSDNQGQAWQTQ